MSESREGENRPHGSTRRREATPDQSATPCGSPEASRRPYNRASRRPSLFACPRGSRHASASATTDRPNPGHSLSRQDDCLHAGAALRLSGRSGGRRRRSPRLLPMGDNYGRARGDFPISGSDTASHSDVSPHEVSWRVATRPLRGAPTVPTAPRAGLWITAPRGAGVLGPRGDPTR
jgi:hypothetical protein